MKKILSAVLVCALAFSMCSCSMFGGSDKKSKSSTGSGVAETTAPLDKTKAESYVIYADRCILSDEELEKYHITFKKIPRDITRL